MTDWSGALWRDSAARKWSRRFLVTGFALPIVAWLGSMSLAYLVNTNPPGPPSLAALDWSFRLVYGLMMILYLALLFQFAALVIVVKAYPRGSWKRRRAIIDAIKLTNARRK